MNSETAIPGDQVPDRLTLIAVSALAYIAEAALHEHAGHGATCLAVGGRLTEAGAFYVSCDDRFLTPLAIRLVELAGPLMSLLTGLVCLTALRYVDRHRPTATYLLWLLGSLGMMSATGYALFSGITGLGDLGTGPDGAFDGIPTPGLARVVLAIGGAYAYRRAVIWSVRKLEPRLLGRDTAEVRVARRTAWTSYWTGAVVYLGIGAFNPQGWIILLTSAMASSMGGTSGLLWMMQRIDRSPEAAGGAAGPGLHFGRDWRWIAAGAAVTTLYAIVLGPTLHPSVSADLRPPPASLEFPTNRLPGTNMRRICCASGVGLGAFHNAWQ